MDNKEILKFCLEQGLLLDREVLDLFSGDGDTEAVKLIIERLKNHTHKKVITKDLLYDNKEKVEEFFSSLPRENQERLEKLKIKLGLSIEISKEILISQKTPPKQDFSENNVKVLSVNCSRGRKFEVGDFINYFRGRFTEMKGMLQTNPSLTNLVSINKLAGTRQSVSLIGLVYEKRVTKNNNLLFDIEDLTGTARILVNRDKEDLFNQAQDIALDSVIGFKCTGGKDILFCQEIVFPEARLFERKRSPVEEYALFVGDLHYGSKNFMKENFMRFLDYLNGNFPDTPEVEKIKYIFIVGDLVTGVGVYPNQERDLVVGDLEAQYSGIAELLGKIRKDIKIIIGPGNHEGVRLMEPQPIYDEKYAWALHEMENVILIENPATINFGVQENFGGFDILCYHGFSYPFYADVVSKVIGTKAMNSPEQIMLYVLKHGHLAPTHGSVQYFPGDRDSHIIRKAPDIFFSGHTHKSGVVYFNNILVVSCSTWETLTPYQEKFGNVPDHCKVPMLNLKTRAVKILDFE